MDILAKPRQVEPASWPVVGRRLVGTDISPEAVRRASLGVYNSVEAGRGIDAGRLSRYFAKQDGKWKVRDEIRAMVSFRTVNLLREFASLG